MDPHNGGLEAQNAVQEGLEVTDSYKLNEEQDTYPHYIEKLDPNPH